MMQFRARRGGVVWCHQSVLVVLVLLFAVIISSSRSADAKVYTPTDNEVLVIDNGFFQSFGTNENLEISNCNLNRLTIGTLYYPPSPAFSGTNPSRRRTVQITDCVIKNEVKVGNSIAGHNVTLTRCTIPKLIDTGTSIQLLLKFEDTHLVFTECAFRAATPPPPVTAVVFADDYRFQLNWAVLINTHIEISSSMISDVRNSTNSGIDPDNGIASGAVFFSNAEFKDTSAIVIRNNTVRNIIHLAAAISIDVISMTLTTDPPKMLCHSNNMLLPNLSYSTPQSCPDCNLDKDQTLGSAIVVSDNDILMQDFATYTQVVIIGEYSYTSAILVVIGFKSGGRVSYLQTMHVNNNTVRIGVTSGRFLRSTTVGHTIRGIVVMPGGVNWARLIEVASNRVEMFLDAARRGGGKTTADLYQEIMEAHQLNTVFVDFAPKGRSPDGKDTPIETWPSDHQFKNIRVVNISHNWGHNFDVPARSHQSYLLDFEHNQVMHIGRILFEHNYAKTACFYRLKHIDTYTTAWTLTNIGQFSVSYNNLTGIGGGDNGNEWMRLCPPYRNSTQHKVAAYGFTYLALDLSRMGGSTTPREFARDVGRWDIVGNTFYAFGHNEVVGINFGGPSVRFRIVNMSSNTMTSEVAMNSYPADVVPYAGDKTVFRYVYGIRVFPEVTDLGEWHMSSNVLVARQLTAELRASVSCSNILLSIENNPLNGAAALRIEHNVLRLDKVSVEVTTNDLMPLIQTGSLPAGSPPPATAQAMNILVAAWTDVIDVGLISIRNNSIDADFGKCTFSNCGGISFVGAIWSNVGDIIISQNRIFAHAHTVYAAIRIQALSISIKDPPAFSVTGDTANIFAATPINVAITSSIDKTDMDITGHVRIEDNRIDILLRDSKILFSFFTLSGGKISIGMSLVVRGNNFVARLDEEGGAGIVDPPLSSSMYVFPGAVTLMRSVAINTFDILGGIRQVILSLKILSSMYTIQDSIVLERNNVTLEKGCFMTGLLNNLNGNTTRVAKRVVLVDNQVNFKSMPKHSGVPFRLVSFEAIAVSDVPVVELAGTKVMVDYPTGSCELFHNVGGTTKSLSILGVDDDNNNNNTQTAADENDGGGGGGDDGGRRSLLAMNSKMKTDIDMRCGGGSVFLRRNAGADRKKVKTCLLRRIHIEHSRFDLSYSPPATGADPVIFPPATVPQISLCPGTLLNISNINVTDTRFDDGVVTMSQLADASSAAAIQKKVGAPHRLVDTALANQQQVVTGFCFRFNTLKITNKHSVLKDMLVRTRASTRLFLYTACNPPTRTATRTATFSDVPVCSTFRLVPLETLLLAESGGGGGGGASSSSSSLPLSSKRLMLGETIKVRVVIALESNRDTPVPVAQRMVPLTPVPAGQPQSDSVTVFTMNRYGRVWYPADESSSKTTTTTTRTDGEEASSSSSSSPPPGLSADDVKERVGLLRNYDPHIAVARSARVVDKWTLELEIARGLNRTANNQQQQQDRLFASQDYSVKFAVSMLGFACRSDFSDNKMRSSNDDDDDDENDNHYNYASPRARRQHNYYTKDAAAWANLTITFKGSDDEDSGVILSKKTIATIRDATTTFIGAAFLSGGAVGMTGLRIGRLSAMRSAFECREESSDTEPLPPSSNPLRIGFGNVRGYHMRGAIVGYFILVLLITSAFVGTAVSLVRMDMRTEVLQREQNPKKLARHIRRKRRELEEQQEQSSNMIIGDHHRITVGRGARKITAGKKLSDDQILEMLNKESTTMTWPVLRERLFELGVPGKLLVPVCIVLDACLSSSVTFLVDKEGVFSRSDKILAVIYIGHLVAVVAWMTYVIVWARPRHTWIAWNPTPPPQSGGGDGAFGMTLKKICQISMANCAQCRAVLLAKNEKEGKYQRQQEDDSGDDDNDDHDHEQLLQQRGGGAQGNGNDKKKKKKKKNPQKKKTEKKKSKNDRDIVRRTSPVTSVINRWMSWWSVQSYWYMRPPPSSPPSSSASKSGGRGRQQHQQQQKLENPDPTLIARTGEAFDPVIPSLVAYQLVEVCVAIFVAVCSGLHPSPLSPTCRITQLLVIVLGIIPFVLSSTYVPYNSRTDNIFCISVNALVSFIGFAMCLGAVWPGLTLLEGVVEVFTMLISVLSSARAVVDMAVLLIELQPVLVVLAAFGMHFVVHVILLCKENREQQKRDSVEAEELRKQMARDLQRGYDDHDDDDDYDEEMLEQQRRLQQKFQQPPYNNNNNNNNNNAIIITSRTSVDDASDHDHRHHSNGAAPSPPAAAVRPATIFDQQQHRLGQRWRRSGTSSSWDVERESMGAL